MDVSFQVVDANQRKVQRQRRRALAKVMPTSRAPARPGPSVTATRAPDPRSVQCRPVRRAALHHRNDVAQVLAAGKFRHHTTVERVHLHLAGDNVAQHLATATHHGCGRLVARAFDPEDEAALQAVTHASLVRLVHLNRIGHTMAKHDLSTAMQSDGFGAALHIVESLRARGFQAYFAGGCVRDLLLGIAPKDYDVATSATPEKVLLGFDRTFSVGMHFGVVIVCTANRNEGCEVQTEVATFRSDGQYSDGRRPDEVSYSDTAEEDVLRRDFTVNGMLLDPVDLNEGNLAGKVLDFVGGRTDLDAKILRAIGDPQRRFAEDKLRMLRAVRFAARFGFTIEPETMRAMQAQASSVAQVSNERVREELTKMLTEGHARRAFELLDEAGLLPHVLPEVAAMKGVEQPPEWHPEGDVWVHTLMLLQKLEPGVKATLAWSALLHDVGKPPTFRAPDPADAKAAYPLQRSRGGGRHHDAAHPQPAALLQQRHGPDCFAGGKSHALSAM